MYASADPLHQQNNKNKLLLKIAIFQELFLSSLCLEKVNLHVEIISIDQIQIPYSALLTFPFIFLFKYAYVCKIVRIAFSD